MRAFRARAALAAAVDALEPSTPAAPDVGALLQVQKHRWLQAFQAPQSTLVSAELAAARDYADPVLRNKWHLVIDTSVLLFCIADDFELFKTLHHTHGSRVVIVLPHVTMQELEKHKATGHVPKVHVCMTCMYLRYVCIICMYVRTRTQQ